MAEGTDAGWLQRVWDPMNHSAASPFGRHEPVNQISPPTDQISAAAYQLPARWLGLRRIGLPE